MVGYWVPCCNAGGAQSYHSFVQPGLEGKIYHSPYRKLTLEITSLSCSGLRKGHLKVALTFQSQFEGENLGFPVR